MDNKELIDIIKKKDLLSLFSSDIEDMKENTERDIKRLKGRLKELNKIYSLYISTLKTNIYVSLFLKTKYNLDKIEDINKLLTDKIKLCEELLDEDINLLKALELSIKLIDETDKVKKLYKINFEI